MDHTRREFLMRVGAAGLGLAAARFGLARQADEPKTGEMPKRPLGKMGWNASLLAFGTAEVSSTDVEANARMIAAALDGGVNYVDTAPSYRGGKAEEAVGRLASRRKEFFLATKTLERGKAGAAREIDQSLRRMKTEVIDLLQIHAVNDPRNLDAALGRGGAIEALEEARKAGRIRFIGITGHTLPSVVSAALDRYPFDSILVPVSALDAHINDFAKEVVPKAVRLGISIAGMKSLKGWQGAGSKGPTAERLLHYAMSLPISTLTCGMTSTAQVERNLAAARAFRKLSASEMSDLETQVKPSATTSALWWKRS